MLWLVQIMYLLSYSLFKQISGNVSHISSSLRKKIIIIIKNKIFFFMGTNSQCEVSFIVLTVYIIYLIIFDYKTID